MSALALVLNCAINHGLRNIQTSKFGSMNRLVDGKINAEIIISGSSRALSHYDPRPIQRLTGRSAYNIGMNASQIDLEFAILKAYLKHNSNPRLVLQNLDLFSCETTKSQGGIYDPGYYLSYLGEDDIYAFLKHVEPNVWKWKYLPLYGYSVEDMRFTWALGLLGCFGFSGQEDYYQGFNPRAGIWNEDFSRFKTANRNGINYALMPEGVTALENIIKLCLERNIRIVLVYSPEYAEMQSLENNRPQIIGKYREIAAKYSVPFWDYSESDICRWQGFFNNSQHLNAKGAAVFSEELAQRLAAERPWNSGGKTAQPAQVLQQAAH